MADEGGISIALTPVQLYAMLNGKSIGQSELASNSWHEMPRPAYGEQMRGEIERYLQTLPAPPSARQSAWGQQGHISQPTPPNCWVPPPVGRPDERTMTRLGAGLQIVGGALEVTGGALLILAPEPTMVTKVGGSALALHGADTMQAAIRQLFSGQPVQDYTQMGGTWAARQAGASDKWAGRVGVILDVAVPSVVFAGMAGATKIVAVRAGRVILSEEAVAGKAGRVSLDVEEADKALGKEGGHTLAKHVTPSRADIEARAARSHLPDAVISRFFSKELAEEALNVAVRDQRFAIQRWAADASSKAPKDFTVSLSKEVGEGYSKATGEWKALRSVKVVFQRAQRGPKTVFVVTFYPIE